MVSDVYNLHPYIAAVWASKWNDRAYVSMRNNGISHDALRMSAGLSLPRNSTGPPLSLLGLSWLKDHYALCTVERKSTQVGTDFFLS